MLRAPLYQSLGLLLLCSVVIFPTQAADEPDWAREQRLDAQTRDAVFDGEPIDLEADGRSFLAIDMEPDEDPKGGVILMHGRGFQPDWHQVAKQQPVVLKIELIGVSDLLQSCNQFESTE